jgi:SpoVK/Ycf46/Vps4 family AAA+-type ATPase
MVETATEIRTEQRHGDVCLARVRLRAQLRALWMKSQASGSEAGQRGAAVSADEIERLLRDPVQTASEERVLSEADPAARDLVEQIRTVDAEFAANPLWNQVRQIFGLSDFEVDLLSTAVAAEVDSSLRRVYAYLHDDQRAVYPTPWLVSRMFPESAPTPFGPRSPLVEWRLLHTADSAANPWTAHTGWIVDAHIMLWLLTGDAPDPTLGQSVQLVSRAEVADKASLYPEQLEAMLGFLRVMSQPRSGTDGAPMRPPAIEIELVGAEGAGKRTLAAQFAAALGAGLLVVDADQLLSSDNSAGANADRLIRAVRLGRLTGSVLYFNNGEGIGQKIWQTTGGYSGVIITGTPGKAARGAKSPAVKRSFVLPPLRREARIALWKTLSAEEPPHVVEEWLLRPAEIAAAALVASAGPDAVTAVCQENLQAVPDELFAPLACPFTWDDIVLPPNLRSHLAEVEHQVRLRWHVYEEWGFERLRPLGRGITALFAGPSGTGKTMAAQVLARSLGLRLLRVDLAGVMNKYIGETEKRLKQVFDMCERANVMLFFDEADALFGQRTQVKDAHDRFANIEVDYLLQRMEQFDGIAVLCTNRKGDLDKAFMRRIRFIVDFFPPGPAERMALWQRALRPKSPSGEDLLDPIDWGFLAHRLNMTGADITAAALSAAFLARSEGRRIGMSHVLHASQRELSKHGVIVRPGDWGG